LTSRSKKCAVMPALRAERRRVSATPTTRVNPNLGHLNRDHEGAEHLHLLKVGAIALTKGGLIGQT